MHAWNFFARHATQFAREFNLMPHLLATSGYDGIALEIFTQKLAMIHDATIEKFSNRAPSDALIGDENV